VECIPVTAASIERRVREQLNNKVSGIYVGLWLLVAEHLRLGTWDLLKTWSEKSETDIDSRISMQIIHESALCVNRVRRKNSVCHQGFDLLNGLPFLVTDEQVHLLLNKHSVSVTKQLQINLGKLRMANGHYNGNIIALDPHRIPTFSQRVMAKKKKKTKESAKKYLQTFFSLDAETGQPICFTMGSPGVSATKATKELSEMELQILPKSKKNILFLADTEHFTAELFNHFEKNSAFEILVPAPNTEKLKTLLKKISYKRKWAGYAIAQTDYFFEGIPKKYTLIVQRSGEKRENYQYKAFLTTGNPELSVKMLTEHYPKRWTIEDFFNFEGNLGWNRASTMNINIRYGKASLALIAQAVVSQLKAKLPCPYNQWTASHIAEQIFKAFDGDIKVKDDTIIVTLYNVPENLNLRYHYENLPQKLIRDGIDPRVPWLYNFKIDFRFK